MCGVRVVVRSSPSPPFIQWGALGVTDQLKLTASVFGSPHLSFPDSDGDSSDRTQLQRHSEVEEPRSSSVNLIAK